MSPDSTNKAAVRLPLRFDVTAAAAEVDALEQSLWNQHYARIHNKKGWEGVGLRTPGGSATHLKPGAGFSDTPVAERCPALRAILQQFECELGLVRLLRLDVGASIREHIDLNSGAGHDRVRLHVPIRTSPDVEFYAARKRVTMRHGECWFLDASYPHSLHNGGTIDRIHLVIDCKVNDWIRSLFPPAFLDGSFRKRLAYRVRVLRFIGLDVLRAQRDRDFEERSLRFRLLLKETGIQDSLRLVKRLTRRIARHTVQ